MKKRILSLLMVAVMLVTMMAVSPSVGAAVPGDAANLSLGEAAYGHAGDEVSVAVYFDGPEFFGLQFVADYDVTRLEFVRITGVGTDWSNVESGAYAFINDNGAPISAGREGFLIVRSATDPISGDHAKVALLTFKIKADAPVGDAFVSLVPTPKAVYSNGTTSYYNKMTYNNATSKVTVLADGVDLDAATDGLTFTFSTTGYTVKATDPATLSGSVVIPAYYDDGVNGRFAVDTIDKNAFSGASGMTSILIPSTVRNVKLNAFLNTGSLATIIVYGDPTFEVGGRNNVDEFTHLIGYNKTVYGVEETNFATRVEEEIKAENECYEEDGKSEEDILVWNAVTAPEAYFLTKVEGVNTSYTSSSSTIAAPGAAYAEGKTFVCWKVGDTTYAPGETVTVTDGMVFEAVMVSNPATTNGASIRLADDVAGLRFTATYNKADYALLAEKYGASNISVGMLITPNQYVMGAKGFTKQALDAYAGGTGRGYVDIAVSGYYAYDDTTVTVAGSLINIKDSTITKNPDFVAIAYFTVTDGDNTFTVYGDYDPATARSVKEVAKAYDADINAGNATATEDQKTWLNTLLDRFN